MSRPLPARTTHLRLFVAAAAFALGCGGNIGGLKADGTFADAGTVGGPFGDAATTAPAPDGGLGGTFTSCGVVAWSSPPPFPFGCEPQVRACLTVHPSPLDVCATPSFGPSLNQVLGDCGIMCTDLLVAVVDGCVLSVALGAGVVATDVSQAAAKCAAAHLVGTRWACAPMDEAYALKFGACVTIN